MIAIITFILGMAVGIAVPYLERIAEALIHRLEATDDKK